MGIPMVCVAHQYLFLHPDFKMPGKSLLPESMLKLFTRITCVGATAKLALSIRQYDDDEKQAIKVVPPLLRREDYNPPSWQLYHGLYAQHGIC